MSTHRRTATSEEQKKEVLDKITHYAENGFPEATRLHEVIMAAGPSLCPRLWYGMPGYAKAKDSAVLCFFRKDTLISFGFTESVDAQKINPEGHSSIPSAWYITKLDQDAERTITEVVTRLV